jgi:K+-sensing histidine kinase KdpD
LGIWVNKLIDSIGGCIVDDIYDETNLAYIKARFVTLQVEVGNRNGGIESVNNAIALCFLRKLAVLTKQIRNHEVSMNDNIVWQDIRYTVVEISKLFGQIHDVEIKNKEICFIEADLQEIKTNRMVVEMILCNLMENAVKYAGYASLNVVCDHCLRVFKHNNHVIFEVSGEGIGIELDEVKEIFSVGYRAEKARRARPPGIRYIPCDLAFCRELAEKIQGKLELYQRCQPTIFRLSLPISG